MSSSVSHPMVDEAEFDHIASLMQERDQKRELVIKRSRDVLKLSKTAIFALHRGEQTKADRQLADAESLIRELLPVAAEYDLRHGSLSGALEEFAEARAFSRFLKDGTLIRLSELDFLSHEEYLGGVCDLTGEVGRYAVIMATKRDVDALRHCHALMDTLMGQLLKLDFRNGPLRKKYDAVKYAVRKLETLLYELSLTKRTDVGAAEEGGDADGGEAAQYRAERDSRRIFVEQQHHVAASG
eukprot:CAMPEP_0196781606 /NCGR_PEP_ID=MMETSP1104-20130614/9934_1 /TAXON_ID=33652 /ORGANISM="Cafeteria sp., Strain Caron Lab Isolate" /LENGTH=240 /DNA_ID=CAMNT_0042151839 /DNA_START=90 /DNA_END=809 /DNA_ORIENTATION=-